MKLWRKPYTVRSYGAQMYVNGYAVDGGYTDRIEYLDIQTNSNDSTLDPMGHRETQVIRAFGDNKLKIADTEQGIKGDMLYFNGKWFECTSSVFWEHTPLSHYDSRFISVTEGVESPEAPTPNGDGNDN